MSRVNIDLYREGIESKLKQEIKGNIIQKEGNKHEIFYLDYTVDEVRKRLPVEAKKVRGVEIKEVSINLWKEGERIFRISSQSATVDRKTRDIIFTGQANLDAGKNGKLLSHRIRWDRKTRLFKIVDSYYLIRNGKKTEGKGIETDYLLKRISRLAPIQ